MVTTTEKDAIEKEKKPFTSRNTSVPRSALAQKPAPPSSLRRPSLESESCRALLNAEGEDEAKGRQPPPLHLPGPRSQECVTDESRSLPPKLEGQNWVTLSSLSKERKEGKERERERERQTRR